MLWSPATARAVFRDNVEIQYHPTIIHYYKDTTPRLLGHLYLKSKAVLNDVFYTHRAEYIKNQ